LILLSFSSFMALDRMGESADSFTVNN
jgi:hypothetical protein